MVSGAEKELMIQQIVEEIEQDIIGRHGIGNEYESLDDDVKEEIRDSWIEIITNAIDEILD